MKRYGYLYEKICDIENLKTAHKNARKGKTHYRDVKIVDSDPDFYITQIHEMLKNKTYQTSEYNIFDKIDKGKERTIYVLPYYPDRIIQWAIVQILEPIWISTLVDCTYSSIKGRGLHKGLRKLQKDLEYEIQTKYCLKLDIRKFYPSINHDILKKTIARKIKDPDVLGLLNEIIDSVEGVPIGNYLSQYFGNLYLSAFDHWIKEEKGRKYYYRYCDDIVVLGRDKTELRQLLSEIREHLETTLNLKIKENYQIFPTEKRGIDFLGYRSFGKFTLLRKSIVKRMKRRLVPMQRFAQLTPHDLKVIASYKGWIQWCDGYRLMKKYIRPLMGKEVIQW